MHRQTCVHRFLLGLLLMAGAFATGCGGATSGPKPQVSSSPMAAASSQNFSSDSPYQESPSHLVFGSLHSIALDASMSYAVYLPAGYSTQENYPVVYLMYGYGGNPRDFFAGLNLRTWADRLIADGDLKPIIMVVPDYKNSFGVNSTRAQNPHSGGGTIGRYEDYLIKELIPHIDDQFATDTHRRGRFIGGYSMGGFAALYLGFNYPELFSRTGAFSAALWDYSRHDLFIGQRNWLYATPQLRARRDPFLLAASQALQDIDVLLDVGMQDPLYSVNENFYRTLLQQSIRVQWHSGPGGHDHRYWNENAEQYLRFFAEN